MTKHKHWREDANCLDVDTEVFFPSGRGTGGEERWDYAKSVCAFCKVRKPCLELALSIEEHDDRWGIYGGLTPLERRAVRIKRKAAV